MEQLFQQPTERALTKAFAKTSSRRTGAQGTWSSEAAIVMPDLTTGRADEEASMAMNDVITDVEAAFDEIYLNYPRHKRMQLAIDLIRQHGNKVRGRGKPMRGLLVSGPTGSGKTTGIEAYVAHLVASGEYAEGRRPILYLRLRKKVTVRKLLRATLSKFGDRHINAREEDELIAQVRNCIERAGVELIIVDDCHHLRNKSTDNLEVTDQLKSFLDDGIAPVAFIGVEAAKSMFEENLELSGRCASPIELTRLDPNNDADVELITEFLKRLDREMVARNLTQQPSMLSSPYNVACLMLASGGVIGQAYRIVRAALLISTSRHACFVEPLDLSHAVERWAIKNKICASNPYRRADLRIAYEGGAE